MKELTPVCCNCVIDCDRILASHPNVYMLNESNIVTLYSSSATMQMMPSSRDVEQELFKMQRRERRNILDQSSSTSGTKKPTKHTCWSPWRKIHSFIRRKTNWMSIFYGKFLTENPWVVILINLFFAFLLLCGLFINKDITNYEVLLTPNNSQSLVDRAFISNIFYDHKDDGYLPSHNPFPPLYAEVIITPTKEARDQFPSINLLKPPFLDQIMAFEYFIYSEIELQIQGRVYKYGDLCAKFRTLCVKEGLTKYYEKDEHEAYFNERNKGSTAVTQFTSKINWPVHNDEFLPPFIGNSSVKNGILVSASAIKLRWYLRQNHDSGAYTKSIMWLEEFLEQVNAFNRSERFLSSLKKLKSSEDRNQVYIQITYAMSESLNMLLNSAPKEDTNCFFISYVFVLVFTMAITGGTNWVTTRSMLAGIDVLALGMATVAALGTVGMFGKEFVNSVSIMPLLVIGNGLDDLFIFMSAWKQTNPKDPEEDRVAMTFRKAGYPICISSVTSMFAFLLSTFTNFTNINNFCFYSASAVLWCFVIQMTFFGSCLAIHARRVSRRRHCLTCVRLKPRRYLLDVDKIRNPFQLLCCVGQSKETSEEIDSLMQLVVRKFISKILLNPVSKCVFIILYVVYLVAACWGASQTQKGVSLFSIVDQHSYFAQHLIANSAHFNRTGVPLMIVFKEEIDYLNPITRTQIQGLVQDLYNYDLIEKDSLVSWLDKFLMYANKTEYAKINITTKCRFLKLLSKFVDNECVECGSDIRFDRSDDNCPIRQSRIHVQARSMWNSEFILDSDFITKVRDIGARSKLPVIIFTGIFVYYEQYAYLTLTALEVLAFSIIALFSISLVLVPSLSLVFIMTFTVISITVGVLGFMHYWSIRLSIITLIDVILGTAYVMDFAVHICLGYMESNKHTRNKKVQEAIEFNGVPIFNGALCTSAAISVFALAKSYLFRSFFKICLLIIAIGAVHCLVFTPVVLSLIGPLSRKPKRYSIDHSSTTIQSSGRKRRRKKRESSSFDRSSGLYPASTLTPITASGFQSDTQYSTRGSGKYFCISTTSESGYDNSDRMTPPTFLPMKLPTPGRTVSVQTSFDQDFGPTAGYSGMGYVIRPHCTKQTPVNELSSLNASNDSVLQLRPGSNLTYEVFNFPGSRTSFSSTMDGETKV